MTAQEYHQLILAAQTIALCVLTVSLIFLGIVLVGVANALRRLQSTRLAVVQIDEDALHDRRRRPPPPINGVVDARDPKIAALDLRRFKPGRQ